VLLALFVLVELRVAQPMLDLGLLRNRAFVGVLLGGMLLTLAAFAAFTYTSIWLQSVLGMTPIQAGLTGLPLSIAAFGVSAGIGRFLHGNRPGPIISAGLVHGSARWPALIPGFVVVGIGVGLATPTLGSAAMSAVRVQRGGMAAGAVNTTRQLGFALGVAALGSVFSYRATSVLADHGTGHAHTVARALSGGQAPRLLAGVPAAERAALDRSLHAAAVSGVQWAYLISGVAGVVAGVAVLVLMRPDGGAEPRVSG
jgi:hypothetical protein